MIGIYVAGASIREAAEECSISYKQARRIIIDAGVVRGPGGKGKPLPLEKFCPECGTTKPVSEFPMSKPRKPTHTAIPRAPCRDCVNRLAAKWYADNIEQMPARRRQNKYGLSDEAFKAMLSNQGGVCAICGGGNGERPLHVDHDHTTGNTRELLCSRCNTTLGLVREDVELLAKIAEYVRKHTAEKVKRG